MSKLSDTLVVSWERINDCKQMQLHDKISLLVRIGPDMHLLGFLSSLSLVNPFTCISGSVLYTHWYFCTPSFSLFCYWVNAGYNHCWVSFLLPVHTFRSKLKVNRILLTTAVGVKYVLEAATAEERDSWLSEIKIASKLVTHSWSHLLIYSSFTSFPPLKTTKATGKIIPITFFVWSLLCSIWAGLLV